MAAPVAHPRGGRGRPVLMALAVVGALGYLAWTLAPNWQATVATLARVNTLAVSLSLLPCLVMYVAKAYYHALIVRQLDASARLLPVMSAYCQAQIVRYLPGKLWGLAYQAGRLHRQVAPHHVVAANAVQTVNTQVFAVGFCATVVLAEFAGQRAWLWLLPLGALAMLALHRSTLLERVGLRVIGLLLRRPLEATARPSLALSARVVALLSFDWLVFWAAWLLLAGTSADGWAVLVLVACYGIASLLATLAIVVPAGLVLREALFVTIGQRLSFSAEELFSLAIVARLVFTIAEVGCLPLLAFAARGSDRSPHAA
jgi:glycosyltransferase 2 family protein